MRSQSKQKGTIIALRLVNQNVVFAYNLSDGTKAQNDTLQEFSIEKSKGLVRTQATEHANNDFHHSRLTSHVHEHYISPWLDEG